MFNIFNKKHKNNNQNEFEDNDLMKIGGSGTGMSRYPVRPVLIAAFKGDIIRFNDKSRGKIKCH